MGDVDRSGESPYRKCKADEPARPDGWPWDWNAQREAVRLAYVAKVDGERVALMASLLPPPPPGPADVAAAVAAGASSSVRRNLRQRVFGGGYEKVGGRSCVYCSWFAPGDMVFDHVPPLALAHEADGVPLRQYLACRTCNAALGAFSGLCVVERAGLVADRLSVRDPERASKIWAALYAGFQRSRCLCGACRPADGTEAGS